MALTQKNPHYNNCKFFHFLFTTIIEPTTRKKLVKQNLIGGGRTSRNKEQKSAKKWYVSTVAGSGVAGYKNAKTGTAEFNAPSGIAVASDGTLYVADTGNSRIRKITPEGMVVTIAARPDRSDLKNFLNTPYGIAIAPDGTLYTTDTENHSIIEIIDNIISVTSIFSGTIEKNEEGGYKDATGTEARFRDPAGIAVASDGTLYVADTMNHRIRKLEYK